MLASTLPEEDRPHLERLRELRARELREPFYIYIRETCAGERVEPSGDQPYNPGHQRIVRIAHIDPMIAEWCQDPALEPFWENQLRFCYHSGPRFPYQKQENILSFDLFRGFILFAQYVKYKELRQRCGPEEAELAQRYDAIALECLESAQQLKNFLAIKTCLAHACDFFNVFIPAFVNTADDKRQFTEEVQTICSRTETPLRFLSIFSFGFLSQRFSPPDSINALVQTINDTVDCLLNPSIFRLYRIPAYLLLTRLFLLLHEKCQEKRMQEAASCFLRRAVQSFYVAQYWEDNPSDIDFISMTNAAGGDGVRDLLEICLGRGYSSWVDIESQLQRRAIHSNPLVGFEEIKMHVGKSLSRLKQKGAAASVSGGGAGAGAGAGASGSGGAASAMTPPSPIRP